MASDWKSKMRKIGREITAEERQMLISVFHRVADHRTGTMTREDLKVAMVLLLGYKPSKYELEQMLSKEGEKRQLKDEGITETEFVGLMSPKLAVSDEDDEIRQTFLAFDSQCRGFIGLDDLMKAFQEVAPHLPVHTVESAFREIDRDGDGRVSFKDFEFMMKYSQENGF